jgi:hypothetical protein
VDTAGDHANSGHPSHAAACPTAVLHDLTPVGHSGRGNPWTPNAGHLDAQTPAPDSGHRSGGQARVDTGRSHRTLDAGRGRGHSDEGTAGICTSWATTPSGRALGRPTVFLGQRLRRLATMTARRWGHLPVRDCLARPGGCSVAPPAKPRLGALLSSDDFGSSVERAARLHPLWRVLRWVAGRCWVVGAWELAFERRAGFGGRLDRWIIVRFVLRPAVADTTVSAACRHCRGRRTAGPFPAPALPAGPDG